MENEINLNSPFRAVIVKILFAEPEKYGIFGRSREKDRFFQAILSVGCDFYELLKLFVDFNGITQSAAAGIIESAPEAIGIKNTSEKELRKLIAHWTPSRYHTAPVDTVVEEIRRRIEDKTVGSFIYNSNLNEKNKKAFNDTYVLMITEKDKVFFDINRRKTYRFEETKEENK